MGFQRMMVLPNPGMETQLGKLSFQLWTVDVYFHLLYQVEEQKLETKSVAWGRWVAGICRCQRSLKPYSGKSPTLLTPLEP